MKGRSKYQLERERAEARKGLPLPTILAMMFASGFAGLVYQVLWMNQLGLLFGNTAHAASVTLAAFFAGLGAGSWWFGKRVGASGNPLRLYAWLEIGIGLGALTYFLVLAALRALYPLAYASLGGSGWMMALKFGLSLALIFPPAFFMGGTIPAIGQALIRERAAFGKTAALIYGTNTLGAALGVAGAAFILIPSFGFRITYALAVALSLGVALVSWRLSGASRSAEAPEAAAEAGGGKARATLRDCVLLGLCFFSGFAVLALEVIWTRIFAQVHENSVYSFAIILTVVIVCLAVGAWISSGIARLDRPPLQLAGAIMVGGGLLLVLTPTILMRVTGELQPVHAIEAWSLHIRRIYRMGFSGVGLAAVALGMLFPFLMKAAEKMRGAPGAVLGRMLAANTLGAISGALAGGFILLPAIGMWSSLRLIAACYLLAAMLLPLGWKRFGIACRACAVLGLAVLFTVLDPSGLPAQGESPQGGPATVVETWEGSDSTVSVMRKPNGHLSLKVNGAYALGSTQAYSEQADQLRIPLLIHPDVRSILNIGLGTGMSAGAALDPRFPKVAKIVSCELTPAVVEAARSHMPAEYTGGVFTDPRSTILIEDGRHHLMATRERYDMIHADLFLPYQRGAGSLYSLEHYRASAERLEEGGVFVQWLPMYQLTEYEFGVIARTMLEAFGQVTMWRNNFLPGNDKAALIGMRKPTPLPAPPEIPGARLRAELQGMGWENATPDRIKPSADRMLLFYCGNLSAARRLFEGYPVNTDDRPIIEYQTPRLFREIAAHDKVIWMLGPKFTDLVGRILRECPPSLDPALRSQPPESLGLVAAGQSFHRSMVLRMMGRIGESLEEWDAFAESAGMSVPSE
ncbi:fused MFS/spermidine synthase [Akkermansiaceae bacterium]|nr:fused MFS/spermidine synthase [Akkermansiaceae bacterium]